MQHVGKHKQTGFTIVELLIVIVVIGILAALVLNAFSGVQGKARDATRLSDISRIRKALEAYYAVNSAYPSCYGGNYVVGSSVVDACATSGGYAPIRIDAALVPSYMSRFTNDPFNTAGQYGYYYVVGWRKTGSSTFSYDKSMNYLLATRLEQPPAGSVTFSIWDNSNLNYLVGSNNP